METVEEQDQLKIFLPKRLKIEETLEEEEEEDRLSALPDCVILHILSLLPETKYAIRTGTLSKQWLSMWTLIPTLIFKQSLFNHPTSDFASSVNKTLIQCRHSKLNKFEISAVNDSVLEPHLNNWINYAIACQVEVLSLSILNVCAANQLCKNFFINSCFTDLKLKEFIINPIGAVSWKNLRSLWISYTSLDEELIENILSGSPELKTLVLESCFGYGRLDITSKSVANLVISGYNLPVDDVYLSDVIEVNAPNILSLKIQHDFLLWKISLLNVSSVIKANLDFKKHGHLRTGGKEMEEEMFKGFAQSLRHAKEIKVGVFCTKVVSRLEAKGFVFPPNMKFTDPTSPSYFDPDCLDYNEDCYDFDSVESGDWEEPLVYHASNDGEVV